MKDQNEDLGGCIVDRRTGERMYIRDELRRTKDQLEQAPYNHYYLDRDEANRTYEEYEQELDDGMLEPLNVVDSVQVSPAKNQTP